MDSHGNHVLAPKYMNKSSHQLFQALLGKMPDLPILVFFIALFLNEIGYFDENLPVCEDYDLWLRLLALLNFGSIASE